MPLSRALLPAPSPFKMPGGMLDTGNRLDLLSLLEQATPKFPITTVQCIAWRSGSLVKEAFVIPGMADVGTSPFVPPHCHAVNNVEAHRAMRNLNTTHAFARGSNARIQQTLTCEFRPACIRVLHLARRHHQCNFRPTLQYYRRPDINGSGVIEEQQFFSA